MPGKITIGLLAGLNGLTTVLCAQVILAGLVLGEDTGSHEDALIYNMEQKIEGNGFSSSYLNAEALNLSLFNKGHGSGSSNYQSTLQVNNGAKYDDKTGESRSVDDRVIKLEESADFSYAPTGFDLGRSLRWEGFQSLGREETCLKNYGSFASMGAAFNGVDTLSKDLLAELSWKSTNITDEDKRTLEDHGQTSLVVDAAFSGRGHIGALISGDIMVDEDYLGAYTLSKNMSHQMDYTQKMEKDDWLPCCSGGFLDMNSLDQRALKSARGVFDCTCAVGEGSGTPVAQSLN